MFNHATEGYDCPFCHLVTRGETSASGQEDVIYRDADVTAFMATKWWPNNTGHVLVVPNAHHENIYDLPPELGMPIQRVARDVALAMKAVYGCDGVSTRQHNEPHGNQDVWHYHVHVYPRYRDDGLYLTRGGPSDREERHRLARLLRDQLATQHLTEAPDAVERLRSAQADERPALTSRSTGCGRILMRLREPGACAGDGSPLPY